jgi:glycosyltransferase involved in cell wall biosynthesis
MIRRILRHLAYVRTKLSTRQFLWFVISRVVRNLTALLFTPRRFFARMTSGLSKVDVAKHYEFVRTVPATHQTPRDIPSGTVNWVIPDFGVGSGGHLNIFRFVRALETAGFSCTIVIDGRSQFASGADAREQIQRHFVPLEAHVVLGVENMPAAEYTFATSWHTAYPVRAFARTRHRCYFVQDFEPYFYAHGSEYVFAENTYKWDLIGITAGTWLAKKLHEDYGMRTFPFGFSFDKRLYVDGGQSRSVDDPLRVFFYARPPTSRRAFELGILVLAEVATRHPEVEIVMAGWDLSGYEIPFRFHDAGILKLDDLPALFRSCDVALVLSYTNVSLLPLELMACGCVVVSNDGPFVEWLLNDEIAKLVRSDVIEMAKAIGDLLDNPNERDRLRKAGLEFCQRSDWDREGRLVSEYLKQLRTVEQVSKIPE